MRLKAYILVADPAWIEASVLSYYDLVEEIVASYDADHRGYTGLPIAVEECVSRLQAIDRDRKICFSPGHYARPDHTPMENETYQRECALREASEEADWVLQLDTDELLGSAAVFQSCLTDADTGGFGSVDYPARWLYRQLGDDRYLEWCSRFWRISAGYPGAVAVRANTPLRVARQCDGKAFHVDFRPTTTTHTLPKETPIHRVIRPDDGLIHYSWVRDVATLKAKFDTWSHSKDRDWSPEFERWQWCGRHPYLATLLSPFNRGNMYGKHLRIVTLPRVCGSPDGSRPEASSRIENRLAGQSA